MHVATGFYSCAPVQVGTAYTVGAGRHLAPPEPATRESGSCPIPAGWAVLYFAVSCMCAGLPADGQHRGCWSVSIGVTCVAYTQGTCTILLVCVPVQVEATADRAAGAAEALESARTKESELLQQRAVLDKELLVSKRREEQLVKQVSRGLVNTA